MGTRSNPGPHHLYRHHPGKSAPRRVLLLLIVVGLVAPLLGKPAATAAARPSTVAAPTLAVVAEATHTQAAGSSPAPVPLLRGGQPQPPIAGSRLPVRAGSGTSVGGADRTAPDRLAAPMSAGASGAAEGPTGLSVGAGTAPGVAAPAWDPIVPPAAPSARYLFASAYDAARRQVVLFGGWTAGGFAADTWVFDGRTWTRKTPASSPSPRDGAVMVYDAARQLVVLYGGWNGTAYLGDTWTWDGTNWTRRTPATSPVPLAFSSGAYLPSIGKVVINGGQTSGNILQGDTYTWDGTTWSGKLSPGTPPGRVSAGMTYDQASGRLLLFGGKNAISYLNDTWTWDGTTWVRQSPASVPEAREGVKLAYDAAVGRTVLYGGEDATKVYGETWFWDAGTWKVAVVPTAPVARSFPALVPMPSNGQLLIFGGEDPADALLADTQVFDWPQLGDRDFYRFDTQQLTDRTRLRVNLATGNLLVETTDLNVRGVGIALSLSRTYNSRFFLYGDKGTGWFYGSARDVVIAPFLSSGDQVIYGLTGGGTEAYFHRNADGSFTSPSGLDATLSAITGGYRLSYHHSSEKLTFTGALLTRHEDRNGNALTFSYINMPDGSKIDRITDSRGRVTSFSYNADGSTASVTDPSGRVIRYGTAGKSVLNSVIDGAGQTTTYGYNGFRLASITDPNGHRTSIDYDQFGRVAHVIRVTNLATGAGFVTTYTYRPYDPADPSSATGRTLVVDANHYGTTTGTTYAADHNARVVRVIDALGHSRSTSWTADSKVGSLTNGVGGVSSFTWGANNGESLTAAQGPMGATTRFGYVPTDTSCPAGATTSGNGFQPICSSDASGRKTTYTYNGPGNLAATTNGAGAKAQVSYNGDGQPATSTDPRNNVTTYGYATVTYGTTSTRRLSTITPPAGNSLRTESVTFDTLDRLRTFTSGRGITATYGYDGDDRVKDLAYSDTTPAVHYDYDGAGNLKTRTDATGTTTYDYDDQNRLIAKHLPVGGTLGYGYDAVGNLTSATQDNASTIYSYDAVNQVHTITDRVGNRTVLAYDADGHRTDTWTSAGAGDPPTTWALHIHVTLDKAGRIARTTTTRASSDANRLWDLSYCYSAFISGQPCPTSSASTDRDQVQWRRNETNGVVATYSYDSAARLTRFNNGGSSDFKYSYDPAGNRHSTQRGTGTITYSAYNSANQLCWTITTDPGANPACGTVLAGADTRYSFGASGNQIQSPALSTLGYDGADRMTTTVIRGGATDNSYRYADRDSTERTVGAAGTTMANGLLGVQSLTSGGQTSYLVRDPSGALVSLLTPNGSGGYIAYHYTFDGAANVIGLIDGAGTERARYGYGGFGEAQAVIAVNGPLPDNPYRFAGEQLDRTGLYKIGARYYDPDSGRWTQQDPISALADPANGNRYAYVANDPADRTDPTGRQCALSVLSLVTSTASLIGATVTAVATAPTGVGFVAAIAWWDVSAWSFAFSVGGTIASC